ncbi:MAG: hypothetical protein WC694_03170 [Candidatus Paceibacterota bacterium]|jgi:hypothetical protein
MKRLLIYIATFFVILIIIFIYLFKNKKIETIKNPIVPEAVAMCYFYSKNTSNIFADRAWLKMSILGDKVTGEYQNLPAEKDSKIGKFSGVVGKMDPKISGRIADVWWDSLAEGMTVTEQLKIEFGEGSAVVFFGEMIDRGDGVYVYKDVTKLTPGFQMSQIDCESLDDRIIVENYIRNNVKTIVPEKPVLGGSWYVISVNINSFTKTGSMVYEDGHIQGEKSFNYVRNGTQVIINLINSLPSIRSKEPVACTMDAKQCPDGSYVGRTGPNCEFVCP